MAGKTWVDMAENTHNLQTKRDKLRTGFTALTDDGQTNDLVRNFHFSSEGICETLDRDDKCEYKAFLS